MAPDPRPPGDRDGLLALKRDLARLTGIPDRREAYFFFLRLGSDWHRYRFSWEPFRELAAVLRPGPGSLPIVIVSDGAPRAEPEAGRGDFPLPHLQLRVSPACATAAIARAWVDLVARSGALREPGPLPAFVQGLRIGLDDLGEAGRRLLLR